REFIRGRTFYANISYSLKIEKNTYVILRELHKFEMSLEAEIPDELKEKLEQTDKEELERIEKYKRGELEDEDAAGIVMMK
ncbi:unnamed protein product, partial [Oikopleura dioica]